MDQRTICRSVRGRPGAQPNGCRSVRPAAARSKQRGSGEHAWQPPCCREQVVVHDVEESKVTEIAAASLAADVVAAKATRGVRRERPVARVRRDRE